MPRKQLTSLTLVQSRRNRPILHTRINIRRQMIQDLQRQMTKRFLGPLDELARVGLGKGNTQVLPRRLPDRLCARIHHVPVMGFASKGVEMAHQAGQVLVCDVGFEAELVL